MVQRNQGHRYRLFAKASGERPSVKFLMRRKTLYALAILAGSWLMLTSYATAQDVERIDASAALAHVQNLGDTTLAILQKEGLTPEQREIVFRNLLSQGLNLEAIGNLVLARNRRTATTEELEEYHRLFGEFVLARYSALLGSTNAESFTILGSYESGRRDIVVSSRIERSNGEPISAVWRVRGYEGEAQIIDVQVENISMVIAQRDEFNSVIQRGGFEALLERLRAHTEMLQGEIPS